MTCHEGSEEENRYNSTPSLTSIDEGELSPLYPKEIDLVNATSEYKLWVKYMEVVVSSTVIRQLEVCLPLCSVQ